MLAAFINAATRPVPVPFWLFVLVGFHFVVAALAQWTGWLVQLLEWMGR
jgi:hypothetical protein